VSGEQDDRNVSRSPVTPEIVHQLPPVTASQREIRDDDVRATFTRLTASLLTINSPDGLETEQAKALDVELTRVVVIVDDEYQRPGRPVPETTVVHV
jgi:hypothetical protein